MLVMTLPNWRLKAVGQIALRVEPGMPRDEQQITGSHGEGKGRGLDARRRRECFVAMRASG